MVKNLWKSVTVVCGNHKEDYPTMYLKQGHRSMFYSCPKYYPDNRTQEERACKNHVSTDDFQKILDRLSDEISDQMYFGGKVSLQNLSFKVKTIQVDVISHKDENIVLKVTNHKALS